MCREHHKPFSFLMSAVDTLSKPLSPPGVLAAEDWADLQGEPGSVVIQPARADWPARTSLVNDMLCSHSLKTNEKVHVVGAGNLTRRLPEQFEYSVQPNGLLFSFFQDHNVMEAHHVAA
jgi:hypothetical protein